jgi:predicted small lipoprotein YifL
MTKRRFVALTTIAAALAGLAACGKKPEDSAPAPTATAPTTNAAPAAGHGGPVIPLGSATIGAFNVVATRDAGQLVAGKDAPIDLTVTPAGATAVRFWIGTEDAKGSVKARAEIENPAEPNRWHTHAEIPNPMPENTKLWVEIEDKAGTVSVGSFDLHM